MTVSTRIRMERILDTFLVEHPGKVINLSKIAEELGISRERSRQLYDSISQKKIVPRKKIGSKKILNRMDEYVLTLINTGECYEIIQRKANLPDSQFKSCLKRLKNLGKIKSYPVRIARKIISEQCKSILALRRHDKSISVEHLCIIMQMSPIQVQERLETIYKTEAGNDLRARSLRRTKQELISLDQRVQELKDCNMKRRHIAEMLKVDSITIANSLRRLNDSDYAMSIRMSKKGEKVER